jgi:hypothetical protein
MSGFGNGKDECRLGEMREIIAANGYRVEELDRGRRLSRDQLLVKGQPHARPMSS